MMLAAFQRGDGGFEQGPRFLFPLLLIALLAFVVTRLRRRRGQYIAGYGVVSSAIGSLAAKSIRSSLIIERPSSRETKKSRQLPHDQHRPPRAVHRQAKAPTLQLVTPPAALSQTMGRSSSTTE
jgi:hypothetical protein